MVIPFNMLFICTKFQGNQVRISYFIANFEKKSKPPEPLKKRKTKNLFWKFACSYLSYAYGDFLHIWNVASPEWRAPSL